MPLPLRQLACIAAIGILVLGCILPNLFLLDQDQYRIKRDIEAGTVLESNLAAFEGEARVPVVAIVDGGLQVVNVEERSRPPYGVCICAPIMLLGVLATLPIFIRAYPKR
jgi:hypothetical protein